jgi:hypothetical protein
LADDYLPFGRSIFSAVDVSTSRTSLPFSEGFADSTSAATPATSGVADEVPPKSSQYAPLLHPLPRRWTSVVVMPWRRASSSSLGATMSMPAPKLL